MNNTCLKWIWETSATELYACSWELSNSFLDSGIFKYRDINPVLPSLHDGLNAIQVWVTRLRSYSIFVYIDLHIRLCKDHYLDIFYLHYKSRNWNIETKRKIGWLCHSRDLISNPQSIGKTTGLPWVVSEIFLPDRCISDLRPFCVPYGSKTDWPIEGITPRLFVCFRVSTRVSSYPGDLTCQIHLPHSFIRFRRWI